MVSFCKKWYRTNNSSCFGEVGGFHLLTDKEFVASLPTTPEV